MSIISIVGFALIAGALSVVLRQNRPEYAMTVSIAAGAAILFMILGLALPVVREIEGLASRAELDTVDIAVLLKALGICYIVELAADACRDAGESSLASKIELGGKLSIVILSLPMITRLVELVAGNLT